MGEERVIPIHHKLDFKQKYVGMLLPVGFALHKDVRKAPVGTLVSSYDRLVGEVVSRAEISTTSAVANSLAWQLYGKPMKDIRKLMRKNWRDEFDSDVVLYLVVKIKSRNANI